MRPPVEQKIPIDAEDARIRALLSVGQPGTMKKRSVVIDGHRTSVSLENAFWGALKLLATQKEMTVNQLVTQIDRERNGNLSSAIRVYVLLSQQLDGIAPGDIGLSARSIQ